MNIFSTYNELQPYLYGAHGIINSGNKCYFNSMIQVLISCPFINKFMQSSETPLAKEYSELVKGNKSIISDIYMQMKKYNKGALIEANSQEDAHEALIAFMEVVERCDKKLYTSIYNCLFHRLCQVLMCKTCGKATVDKFEELMFHFDNNCSKIQEYICDEEVEHKCVNCSPNVNIKHTKSQKISRLGPIIFIAYKQYTQKQKPFIQHRFTFNNIDGESIHMYELVAQIQHSGTQQGGHYYSICRRNDGIYVLNDSSVSRINDFGIDANTYILVYSYIGTMSGDNNTRESRPSPSQRS